MMPRLDDLLRIGMDSLKVEGRNKTEYYAGVVARAYRKAIDDWYENPETWDYRKYMSEIMTLQNRGYCLGFHDGKLTNVSQNYEYTRTLGEWLFAGSIVEWDGDDAIFELRNYITKGDVVEFLIPGGLDNYRVVFDKFEDAETGELTEKVSAGQGKRIRIRPEVWGRDVNEIKELLPCYVVARKFQGLSGENKEMYGHKQEEWSILCDGGEA
jgi:putative protease